MMIVPFGTDVKVTLIPKIGEDIVPKETIKHLKVCIVRGDSKKGFTPIYKVGDAGIEIEIQRHHIKYPGVYKIILDWRRPDAAYYDGYQDISNSCSFINFSTSCKVMSDNTADIEISPIYKGDKGDKGDSAYQVWLEEGNIGTEEDYLAYLRQPAIDAGASISELEGEIQVSEGLRVQAESERDLAEVTRIQSESERLASEIIRQSNEGNRIDNEATRVQNEAERISEEGIRQSNETDRVEAEGIRQSNEIDRIEAEEVREQAESERLQAESERKQSESERVQAETARVNAEGDATKGRVKAENERVQAEIERAQAFAQMMGEADDKIEEMDTTLSTYDGRVTQVEADIDQLAGDVSLLDAVQGAKIKDIENVLSTANLNQSAQVSVSGVSPLSLPKNAANGGMSVKLEGLTADVGGVITHFEPTGRVRSVDKNGLNPTALYLTAPELRSNGTVKDEIRKGANGYELVKRVGIATLSAEKVVNGDFSLSTGWTISGTGWSISDGKARCNSTSTGYIRQNGGVTMGAWQKVKATVAHTRGTSEYITGNAGARKDLSEGLNSFFIKHAGTSPDVVFFGGNYEGTLDDVSIKELVPQDGAISNTSTFTELSDGTILYTLATPEIIPISYGGALNSAENGTIYHEPIIADAGVYDTKIDVLLTDFPINVIEEVVKYENGINTYLDVSKAVIAGDGLSFTHPDLADGDLVLFTYAYSKESTNGNITATFYDSNVVKIDTVTGKAYRINEVVTNGVLTRTLTEV